ncbi:BTB/POZ and MATH domain-containing protein 2-like [Lolium rigidum]|uniref:BTB/POZ and MATH domain-containing protein 2-like n=1 Tax=Lolium rigidum TaxID=89674 RepID=UPI001F5CCCE3|nr:BTB/POZ and MATH domain-containing protein 2-like [Lolium rigidum]
MPSSSEPVPDAGDTPTPAHTASTIVAEGVSGSHVLTVQGYSHTIGLGFSDPIPSSLFSLGGHTWQVDYYPDGMNPNDVDNWISLSLSLHRADLTDTGVKVRCRFSLLDQAGEPVPEYTTPYQARTCHRHGHGIKSHRFIKRDELESSAYLKHDRFSIRCDLSVAKEIRTQHGTATPCVVATLLPSSDMSHQLGRILETGEGADVTFEVGGETFAAHRPLLAARSSVFTAQLFGPMKDNGATCIRIDDMEPKVFKMMLHFIYTDTLPSSTTDDCEVAEMAQHLFVAADRYNLERLKLVCQNTLCTYMDARTVATTLALAEQHGCDELKEACHKFLASFQNLKAVIATDGFKHLKTIRPNILQELFLLQVADAP